jgi:hypothetical protein
VAAWLRGWLGDVTAGVWFVAENPSLTQIRRIHTTRSTFESQWAASAGDRMFRHALCELGLKTRDQFEPGGWRCYITDVMKSVVFVKDWQGTPVALKRQVEQAWAPVLRFQLERGMPRRIVALGRNAEQALRRLEDAGVVPELPPLEVVDHYAFVMGKPEGQLLNRKHGDPARVAEWTCAVAQAAGL